MVHGTGRNCRCRYLVDDLGRDGNEEAENCGYLSHPAHILTAAQSLVRTASGLVSGHMVPSDVILRRTCPCWGLRPYVSLLITIRVNMIVLQIQRMYTAFTDSGCNYHTETILATLLSSHV